MSYIVITDERPARSTRSQKINTARLTIAYILDKIFWFGYSMNEVVILWNNFEITPRALIHRGKNEKMRLVYDDES